MNSNRSKGRWRLRLVNLWLNFRKKEYICWWGCGSRYRMRSPYWWRRSEDPAIHACPKCALDGVLNILTLDQGKPWRRPEGTYLTRVGNRSRGNKK